jgi:hypothetical protein
MSNENMKFKASIIASIHLMTFTGFLFIFSYHLLSI